MDCIVLGINLNRLMKNENDSMNCVGLTGM